jgi:hypothetical protein
MPATLSQVVKQFQQEWTTQLEPEAILGDFRKRIYLFRRLKPG